MGRKVADSRIILKIEGLRRFGNRLEDKTFCIRKTHVSGDVPTENLSLMGVHTHLLRTSC